MANTDDRKSQRESKDRTEKIYDALIILGQLAPICEELAELVDLGLDPEDLPRARDVADRALDLCEKAKKAVKVGQDILVFANQTWAVGTRVDKIVATVVRHKTGEKPSAYGEGSYTWAVTELKVTAFTDTTGKYHVLADDDARYVQVWGLIEKPSTHRDAPLPENIPVAKGDVITFKDVTFKGLLPRGEYGRKHDLHDLDKWSALRVTKQHVTNWKSKSSKHKS
jgi:hypothetical protein